MNGPVEWPQYPSYPGTINGNVYWIQRCLIDLGYDCGSSGADGQMGANTKAAIKSFQSNNGLDSDGLVGEQTWNKLLEKLHEKYSDCNVLGHNFGGWTRLNDSQHSRTCGRCGYSETADHSWNSGVVTKNASASSGGEKMYTCTVCGAKKTELQTPTYSSRRYFGGHLYELYKINTSWNSAKAYAESKGGHLITITSKEEQALAERLISGSNGILGLVYSQIISGTSDTSGAYWIGASDTSREGTWQWVTGEVFDYANWDETQPDNWNNDEDFATIWTIGVNKWSWNDYPSENSNLKGFIVEYEPSPAAVKYSDGRAYELYCNINLSWHSAKLYASSKGGHLVAITSDAEQKLVEQLLSDVKIPVWIGASDETEEGTWEWVTGEAFEYGHWCAGEPNNDGNEDFCGIINGDRTWNDYKSDNSGVKGFVIEYEPSSESHGPGAPHTWDSGVTTKAATCVTTGVKTFTCSVCSATKTETISYDPSNHTGGTEIKGVVAATCGTDGYTGDTYCKGCGTKMASGNVIPKTDMHAWNSGKETTIATCSDTGIKTYICTVCNATKTETIPAIGHSYGAWTKLNDTQHQRVCANDSSHVEKANHTWNSGVVTTAATCTAAGVKTYTCTVCNATKTETIPATGHNYGAWTKLNDTQHQRVCANDSSHVEKVNHTWNSGVVTMSATCSTSGAITYTCTVCNATKTETISNDPSNHTGGTEIKDAVAATCGADGYTGDTYCKGCNAKISSGNVIPKTDKHNWDAGEVTKQPTATESGIKTYQCAECGKKRTESIPPTGEITDACITVGTVSAAAGSTVKVDVSVANNPGFSSFSIGFDYDTSRLKLTSVTVAPELGGQFAYNKRAVWMNNEDTTYNGTILTLTFDVLADTEDGDAFINAVYDSGNISNLNEHDVPFTAVGGKVTVRSYIPGDINNDGNVNNKDLTRLMKYLAGENVTVVEPALDVNGDGKVNNKDLTRLLKFIAGDPVEIH